MKIFVEINLRTSVVCDLKLEAKIKQFTLLSGMQSQHLAANGR